MLPTANNKMFALRALASLLLALVIGSAMTAHAQDAPAAQDLRVKPEAATEASAPQPAPVPLGPIGGAIIYPEDVLDVYFFDVPELSRDYTVDTGGSITVPLLAKPVRAAGLTADQLARSLEESFRQSGRLSHPQITVTVKQSRRSVVTVEGAVKSPQAVPVIGATPLITVLSLCGGRSDDAGTMVTVTRSELAMHEMAKRGATPAPTEKVQYKQLADPNNPVSKVEVWPGDRVSVERAGLFYVLGQVGRPGGYNLKSADEQVSVLQALALAGDVTGVAQNKAMLIRKDAAAPDGRREIALNLKSILQGHSPDRTLQADDILYIPASGGKKAMHTVAGIGTTAASAAIYTRF